MRATSPAVPLLVLALAACGGGVGWHKAGSDAETLKRDLGDCQALAYDKVSRSSAPAPSVALDRRFGNLDAPDRTTEARIREQQLVDGCMREKGYSFEPAAR
ncbi:MAG: hypothetical protein ACT4P9_09090 [Betaproteobacteria bacterium]